MNYDFKHGRISRFRIPTQTRQLRIQHTMPRHGDQGSYYQLHSNIPVSAPKGPLCDEILWMIATNLQNDWEEVAFHLGMSIYAVNRIAICYPPQERLFAALRDWRSHSLKMNPPQETSVELANTMIKLNRYDLSQIVIHRFQQSLMCA